MIYIFYRIQKIVGKGDKMLVNSNFKSPLNLDNLNSGLLAKGFENIVGKTENAGNQYFLLFL